MPLVHPLLAGRSSLPAAALTDDPDLLDAASLATLVADLAGDDRWRAVVQHRQDRRWYTRLLLSGSVEVWLIGWSPGQHTGVHHHGGALGALAVAEGTVTEVVHDATWRPHRTRHHQAGVVVNFGAEHVHQVLNLGVTAATTIHAYSPPERPMGYAPGPESGSRIDRVLAEARAKLHRLEPSDAATAVAEGALLVDIRPAAQRASEGEVPGALVIERNVLEWRFDPTSEARLDTAVDDNVHVVVLCSEGYTSSLAAASLQDLGLRRATDVVGGFQAWARAGLPIT